MSDLTSVTNRGPGRPLRETKPKTIDVGSDVLVRNDVVAAKEGRSERALNRGDAKGDPFVLIGGVKYRPERGHNEFIVAKIVFRNQPSPPRPRPGKRNKRR